MNIAAVLGLDRTETKEGEWSGHKFSVSYFPARMTSPVAGQGLHEGVNGYPLRLAETLALLLSGWDIDFNGEPFPPTKENLSICPWDFVVYVTDLIVNADG